MSASTELMVAILAMDAYNRGYNPGITLSGTEVGNAAIRDITVPLQEWQDADFYAVAYEWNGETIISCRGTDSKGELLGTHYTIAVNDDYDEVRVFPSRRTDFIRPNKFDFWKRAEA